MTTSATSTAERTERRRREVCVAARTVIVRQGLEATTLRDIAREGGFTTGVVSHYFPDKTAVIVGTFTFAADEWNALVYREVIEAPTAEESLVRLVRVSIPSDPVYRSEWRLWSEMWTYAARDGEFAERLVDSDVAWERFVRDVLERASGAGLISTDLDIDTEAAVFARLVDGLGLRSSLSGRWEAARRQLVHHMQTLRVSDDLLAQMLEDA
jgi:AcrR family transcriptional regulator